MSIVPQSRGASAVPLAVRTLLFWGLMIGLAVVLWQMSSRTSTAPAPQMSYSDFMKQVDAKNLQSAKFTLAQNTANVSGSRRKDLKPLFLPTPRRI